METVNEKELCVRERELVIVVAVVFSSLFSWCIYVCKSDLTVSETFNKIYYERSLFTFYTYASYLTCGVRIYV